MKTVFMFSGQGAQYAGMGKELYDNYSVAKEVFDKADEVLGFSIKDICFNDEEKLGNTEYAQPAILTMSIAAMKVLKEQGIRASMTAGLSLGEYSALVAGGALSFEDAVALVRKRGKFMAEAVPAGQGAMYAIIGLDREVVEEVCKDVMDSGKGYVIAANYNCPGQIAIAGEAAAADEAAAKLKEKGAKMAVKLKVSGPFHTELLQSASDKLHEELLKIDFNDMKIPVYTNLNAEVIASKEDIVPTLTKQVISPVKWEDIVRNMNAAGADTFIELGPGKALTGFVKRTLKGVNIMNIEDVSTLNKALDKLS
ncbi:MAG: ACP S-malonyltransferase [Lachnospiraceae bacterium]|nr:ACP S-malonyltransferase [Lachnospiraceae bacterium]